MLVVGVTGRSPILLSQAQGEVTYLARCLRGAQRDGMMRTASTGEVEIAGLDTRLSSAVYQDSAIACGERRSRG